MHTCSSSKGRPNPHLAYCSSPSCLQPARVAADFSKRPGLKETSYLIDTTILTRRARFRRNVASVVH